MNQHISDVFSRMDRDGPRKTADNLLHLILLRALLDRAVAHQFFVDTDDDCFRNQCCLAVPRDLQDNWCSPSCLPLEGGPPDPGIAGGRLVIPDPYNPDYQPLWFEFVPLPMEVAPRLFSKLRWHSDLRGERIEGAFPLRFHARDITATVIAPYPDDVRIYFGSARPPIRPKLARQFAELGLPPQ